MVRVTQKSQGFVVPTESMLSILRKRNAQRGSTTVEYSVVTLIVITALFVPLGGPGSLSGVGLLLQGLRNFQMHTSFLLSLP